MSVGSAYAGLFSDNKFPNYSINTNAEKKLKGILHEELDRQRETNIELQQYTRAHKIARFEQKILNKRLEAEGFYSATVAFQLENKKIIYQIETGKHYKINTLSILTPSGIQLPKDTIKLKVNDVLKAQDVLDALTTLKSHIQKNNCLYETNVDYRAVVDHTQHNANLEFIVQPSISVNVRKIETKGLDRLDPSYVKRIIPIKSGECFQRTRLARLRLSLLESNLFASVDTQVSEPLMIDKVRSNTPGNSLSNLFGKSSGKKSDKQTPIDATVDLVFIFTERNHRTISAGTGFETDDGFGVSLGWESRNLWSKAQNLKIETRAYERAQSLSGTLTLPYYRRKNQKLIFSGEQEKEQSDAYDGDISALGVDLERQLSRRTKGRVGIHTDFSRIEEDGELDELALLSVPVSIEYDRRDSELDSRRGWAGAITFEPYTGIYETSSKFLKTTLALSAYKSFNETLWKPTLAIRTALGNIEGASRDDVPAYLRFYSGGGGSVRGYAYQTVGPLDDDNEPDGGLSFNEVSFELRMRWGESWGGVLFIDGGTAYEDTLPNFGTDLLLGAGFGVRFYTSFAPIRFDVAVPLNKREDIDDDFQLYISIGQAF